MYGSMSTTWPWCSIEKPAVPSHVTRRGPPPSASGVKMSQPEINLALEALVHERLELGELLGLRRVGGLLLGCARREQGALHLGQLLVGRARALLRAHSEHAREPAPRRGEGVLAG